jgi:hypothetical protein
VRPSGKTLVGGALGVAIFAALAPGCSLGGGHGSVTGTLDVPLCWSGGFDLKPNFFAAVPSMGTGTTPTSSDAVQIRIQNGGDFEAFSDGLSILVDDAGEVRGDPDALGNPRPSLLGKTLIVSLPPGVTPPGVPIMVNATPSIVHATLYLQKTCRTQNVALYAVDAVSLEADGTCNRPATGEAPPACGAPAMGSDGGALTVADAGVASAAPDSGAPVTPIDSGALATMPDAGTSEAGGGASSVGTSTITFTNLFDGNPAEENAQKRLTDATFHFYLADPREICPGGVGPPPRCRGDISGYFKFYFQRGRPAQPFSN